MDSGRERKKDPGWIQEVEFRGVCENLPVPRDVAKSVHKQL